MIIQYSKEKLLKFLEWEIKAWENIGGGPNMSAYHFDVSTANHEQLEKDGYYDNIDAWIAGVRIQALYDLMHDIRNAPEPISKF
jgi:hypothetical protein